ncbi:hypothetical protein D3C71_1860470 [compost metagenome]
MKVAAPARNIRRRPKRSASAPASSSVLPKASMKALVTQFSASAEPPSAWLMEGNATAGPVKLSGMAEEARHTASRIKAFRHAAF